MGAYVGNYLKMILIFPAKFYFPTIFIEQKNAFHSASGSIISSAFVRKKVTDTDGCKRKRKGLRQKYCNRRFNKLIITAKFRIYHLFFLNYRLGQYYCINNRSCDVGSSFYYTEVVCLIKSKYTCLSLSFTF